VVELPKFDEFISPLLEILNKKGEMYYRDAIDSVIKKMSISDEQLAVTNESDGKSKIRDRVYWAGVYLKQVNAVTRPKRGYISLGPTAEGLLKFTRPITEKDLKAMPEWKEYQSKRVKENDKNIESDIYVSDGNTPQDLIDKGIKSLRSQLIADLLEQVKGISPAAFEGLVLQVLAKMGYGGGDAKQIQGVPRGPDGGIDGKINEDKLGLDQIYIQAKRYSENSVGRPTVQSFVGAMSGGGCKKGVFVTSSTFTSDAKSFADGLKDVRLVLIDGVGLAKLMIEHCVGVQVKETIRVAKIDQDFFLGEE
jgi:restriction system protein